MGAVYAYVILLTFIGPEYLGKQFGIAHDHDMEEAVGHDAIEHAIHPGPTLIDRNGSSEVDEKGETRVHHVWCDENEEKEYMHAVANLP